MRVCAKGSLSANGLKENCGNKYSNTVLLLLKKRCQGKSGAHPHPSRNLNCLPCQLATSFSIIYLSIYFVYRLRDTFPRGKAFLVHHYHFGALFYGIA